LAIFCGRPLQKTAGKGFALGSHTSMKSLMILGAITGFVLGAASSLAGDSTAATSFWHASVTALVAGLLARWCGRMWLTGLADSLEQQRRARAQASEKKNPAKV
jgi:hypothetical protein